MVINGRSVILSLTLLVFLAVSGYYLMNSYYLQLADNPDDVVPVDAPIPPGLMPSDQPDSIGKLSKDFFNEHRLERDKQRSLQIELLREIINNVNTNDAVRQQAQTEWLILTQTMEKEMAVEKLVMSKGFADAILLINNDIAHIIVKTSGLSQAEAIQITELVASALNLDASSVRVIERS
ncbi:MAG: SpoIIIAH-like family protein [Firmicutes bacterium]|nr:SpoIIIAH-like family protein [Bacillota bacterium]